MDDEKNIILQAQSIIAKAIKLMPDDAKGDFMTRQGKITIDNAIGNAFNMLDGNEEKEALLRAYAIQEANRAVTLLWREKLLSSELEAEYRELPSMKWAADNYNKYINARKERLDALSKENNKIADEEKDLDIFKGVINGMKKTEAKKRYEEYRKQMQEAMSQGAK